MEVIFPFCFSIVRQKATTTPLERRYQHEKENHFSAHYLCYDDPLFSAVAADEPASQLTIEEILNEYHQKAMEAQTFSKSDSATTWSRNNSSNTKTLEQETVETLTLAGYEAYSVTASNYGQLEADLNTDFAEMGLDPDSSYIMVINDEASQISVGRAAGGSDIVQNPGDMDGGSGIRYTYEGTTYTMRSVTIASNADSCLRLSTSYAFLEENDSADYISDVLSFLASWGIDSVCYGLPVTGVYTLWQNWSVDEVYSVLDESKPNLLAATSWTLRYTQVWDDALGRWVTSQCSSYANTNARVTGYVYNNESAEFDVIDSGNKSVTVYSSYYNSYEYYALAARGFIEGVIYRDYANVGFYFFNSNDVCINIDGSPLFIHEESSRSVFPIYEYVD